MRMLKIDVRSGLADSLRWGAYAAGKRLGVFGVLAGVLLAALLVIDSMVLQPRIEAVTSTRDSRLLILGRLPEPRMLEGKPRMSLKEVQKLRGSEQAYETLLILQRHQISRKQTTYHYMTAAKGRLARLSVDIALGGTYTDLRAAMRKIADQPMARIERVAIERTDIDSRMVNATLRVSYLGADK